MSDPIVRTVRAVVAPITRTRAFRWLAPRLMPPIERAIATVTGSSIQLSGLLVPSLVLRTIDQRVPRARLEKELAKFYAGKKRKADEC